MSSSNINEVSAFDELPRDMLLIVVSKFDMDTRIKMGIIGKLRVPQKLNEAITKSYGYRLNGFIEDLTGWVRSTTIKLPISNIFGYEIVYWPWSCVWHWTWVIRFDW